MNESIKRLTHIINHHTKKAGISNILSVAAGVSGAGRQAERTKLENALQKSTGIKRIKILPDTETAFAASFDPGEKNCGILIAGTGSVLFFRNKSGTTVKTGGWGRYFGDEGSGYWIASEALRAVTMAYDGRGRKTSLSGILKRRFCIDSANIIKEVYHNGFEISVITEFVFRAAGKNDAVTSDILKKAAMNLIDHLKPLGNKKYSIALTGSLFTREKLLEKYFLNFAKQRFNKVTFIKSGLSPVYGALKIAHSIL